MLRSATQLLTFPPDGELIHKLSRSSGLKTAVFDLETSDLAGDFGRILCGVIYDPIKRRYHVFRNDDEDFSGPDKMADDGDLAAAIRDKLEEYHLTIGWYTKGFDYAMLNSRLMKVGERPIKRQLHIDSCFYCRGWRGLKARNSKLGTVAEFFDLPRKPSVDADVWVAARHGDKDALDEVVDRCKADCRITWLITEKLLDNDVVKNVSGYP